MANTSESMASSTTPTTTPRTTSTTASPKNSILNVALIFLLIAGIYILSFVPRNSPISLSTSQSHDQCPLLKKTPLEKPKPDELEEALSKASMANKTVIIAVVNRAYVEGEIVHNMLDLFLEGFWAGEGTRELINHVMIVAMDQTAYYRCVFRGLHCYRLETDGVDFMGEKVFMSDDFIKMMWRRTLFLLDVLKKGYSFIFTDTDVMWLRNPFTVLITNKTQEMDIQFSTDLYNGNSSSLRNPINTGFYFVKSNNKTISLFEKWYTLKDNYTGIKEQDVLQNIIWQGALGDLGLKHQYLDTKYFSGFCHDSKDIRAVITIHANCCRFISAKVADLTRVLHEWAQFKIGSSNETTSFRWSKHVECVSSWKIDV